MSEPGIYAFSPTDGSILWRDEKKAEHILQPALISADEYLLNIGSIKGTKRVKLKNENGAITSEEVWASKEFKPFFSDSVVHNGYVYGYNGSGLVCADLKDGSVKWKGARHGGQLLLIESQGLLVILSEKGEVVLAKAAPDKYSELAIFKAIEGKTWNHPAIAGDMLIVRNTKEMAAYRLTN